MSYSEQERVMRGGSVPKTITMGAVIMTDEAVAYGQLSRDYFHHTVNHSAGEYVRHYTIHTNGIESVWALLKRQIIGIHHWVSPKHLPRYVDEMSWRQNRRDMAEGARMDDMFGCVEGRLTYKALIA